MSFWTETEEDVFSCFKWFSESEATEIIGYKPEISVFSIIGSGINSREDKDDFIGMCSGVVNQLEDKFSSQGYRFYFFAIIEETKEPSRIAMHYRLWKKIAMEWNAPNLVLGPELEYFTNDKCYFVGFAEFDIKEFGKILRIAANDSTRFAIFCTRNKEVLTTDFTKKIFEKAYLLGRKNEIDYFLLTLSLPLRDSIIFRWGDSSEECELDCMINKENISLFSEYCN